MLTKLAPNLMVEDVNKTVEYYKEVLGFELVMTVPEEGTFDWAMIKKNEVIIMLQSRESLEGEITILKGQQIGGAFTLYITVDNIKEFYEGVRVKVEVLHELHTKFYGKQEFVIQDPNGYILVFAE